MKVKIEVTEEDIALGTKCNSDLCPVNRAMRRAAPGRVWTTHTSCVADWTNHKSYDLPEEATLFILANDEGKTDIAKPFSFEMEIK